MHGNIQVSGFLGSLAAGVAWSLRESESSNAHADAHTDLKTLLKKLPTQSIKGKPKGKQVKALVTDSRRVVPGSLFFAIKGQTVDGSAFIPDALSRGAIGIVCEAPLPMKTDAVVIQVKDVRETLARIAQRFYAYPDESLRLVGVTGTNGKTTVASHTRYLLEGSGTHPVGMLGTVSYELGQRSLPSFKTTPESVDCYALLDQMRQNGCQSAVMEVSSHGIDQKRVHGMHFEIAVFLNITQDHLDYHKDFETYFQTKAKLFTGELGTPPKVVVINKDDPFCARLISCVPEGIPVITFGTSSDATLYASEVVHNASGTRFTLNHPKGKLTCQTPLLGQHNLSNVLASLSIAWVMGRDLETLTQLTSEFKGVSGRLEPVKAGQGFSVYVDYAHTADALTKSLQALKSITPGRVLLVFGCGGNRDPRRRIEMTQVAQSQADHAWATADNPRKERIEDIFSDMKQGAQDASRIAFIADRRQAIYEALRSARRDDCVVICGKGHEPFQEVGDVVMPFDDRDVTRSLLESLRYHSGSEA